MNDTIVQVLEPFHHCLLLNPTAQPCLVLSQYPPQIYDDGALCSAIAAAFTSATFLTSPCLPFFSFKCQSNFVSKASNCTHVPLGHSQLHLSSSLSCQSLVILQASSNDSCGDRQVFVVADEAFVSRGSYRGIDCPIAGSSRG